MNVCGLWQGSHRLAATIANEDGTLRPPITTPATPEHIGQLLDYLVTAGIDTLILAERSHCLIAQARDRALHAVGRLTEFRNARVASVLRLPVLRVVFLGAAVTALGIVIWTIIHGSVVLHITDQIVFRNRLLLRPAVLVRLTLDLAPLIALPTDINAPIERLDLLLFCRQVAAGTRERLRTMLGALPAADRSGHAKAALLLTAMAPDFVIQK
jgi:hypothetical protein